VLLAAHLGRPRVDGDQAASKVQDVNDDNRDAIIRQARIALGSRLREIRESRGMTQTAVARQADLSRSFYAQVEYARQAISVDRAFAIANVLGVEMSELFTAFPAVPHARSY
jgi:DNA-binding XRE family transcriptional regulator